MKNGKNFKRELESIICRNEGMLQRAGVVRGAYTVSRGLFFPISSTVVYRMCSKATTRYLQSPLTIWRFRNLLDRSLE